ncbi:hypothetical protein GCM10017600_79340 [Streptosporangium carneum]|uniref:Ig-like domain-containing protein n=1 Tax=Streptosporangium carneum TaxID=47481 RepID=A0A9W6I9H3_9ACTN|nr:hypothetical protein GCM10017600_79340 [Streptosporangium carneum]
MRALQWLLGLALVLGMGLPALPAGAEAEVRVSVTRVKASPARHTGKCPVVVEFSARITVKGSGVVRYHWGRSDGTRAPVRTLKVQGRKTVVVRDRQVFDKDTKGWQAIRFFGVKPKLSGKAAFSVKCGGLEPVYDGGHPLPPGSRTDPVRTAASVTATPSSHSGACPATVGFTATLQVSRVPARVAYRWVDSLTGEGPLQYADFGAGTGRSRTVSASLTVTASGGGWKAVRTLGPGGAVSTRANYTVTCGSGQPVATPAAATETQHYSGPCPATVRFTGKVTVDRVPAEVAYEWVDSRGGKGPSDVLTFTGAPGSEDVIPYDRRVEKGEAGTVTLRVLTPKVAESTIDFTVRCQDGNPAGARATVTDIAYAGTRSGPCGQPISMLASGVISAPRGPATITYEWVKNGRPIELTDEAASTGTGPWKWDVIRLSLQKEQDASGSVAIKIHNDGGVSPALNYSSACAGEERDLTLIATVPDHAGACSSEGPGVFVHNRATIIARGLSGSVVYQWARKTADGRWADWGSRGGVSFRGDEFETRSLIYPWKVSNTETRQWKLTVTHKGKEYETPVASHTVTCA